MQTDSKELEDYIKEVISAIKNGVSSTNYRVDGSIKFHLAVTNMREGAGGLKIYVANAGGKVKSEEISTISFDVKPDIHAQQFQPTRHDPNQYI